MRKFKFFALAMWVLNLSLVPGSTLKIFSLNAPTLSLLALASLLLNGFIAPRERFKFKVSDFGITVLGVTGLFPLVFVAGSPGLADFTEFAKWLLALTMLQPLSRSTPDSKMKLVKIYTVGAAIGATFSVLAIAAPNRVQLMNSLTFLGYLSDPNSERIFLFEGVDMGLRAYGSYGDPNIAGMVFAIAIGLTVSVYPKWSKFSFLLIFPLLLGLILSQSRSAMIGEIFFVILLITFTRTQMRTKVILATGTIFTLCLAFSFTNIFLRFGTTLSNGDLGFLDRQRSFQSFMVTMKNHWITGFGWARPEFRESAAAFHANVVANAPLAVVYRGGLISIFGYLCLITCIGITILRHDRGSQVRNPLLAVLASFMLISQFGNNTVILHSSFALFIFLLSLPIHSIEDNIELPYSPTPYNLSPASPRPGTM